MNKSTDKLSKFEAAAVRRVTAVDRALRRVAMLAGPAYEATPDRVEAVFSHISQSVAKAKARFEEQRAFSFPTEKESSDDAG